MVFQKKEKKKTIVFMIFLKIYLPQHVTDFYNILFILLNAISFFRRSNR